ncbi:MAG: F0F1 ATP synthase subunit alpha [Candidatus Omnitrophica bacterium]|nr:F0F1 ATP synthase subunit alpha [Candidatus Omnitrophota bacterium]
MPKLETVDLRPKKHFDIREIGRVETVRKFIVIGRDLPSCINGEVVEFANGERGVVMGFKDDKVQILVMGSATEIRNGDEIYNRGEELRVPVGKNFIGRIVSGIGNPVDRGSAIEPDDFYPVFREAPGVMDRVPVKETLETGTICLDAGIPVALGQRQLLIGDRMTGKTTVAIDAILNQKSTGVICIYCCIGKPYVSLMKQLHLLNERGAMAYTIIVNGTSSAPVAEQYLAPYTACSLGEFFMHNGQDVLVVFDDFSKHAWVYREISLLLERAPGREAYPGDIFYIHSQLVERAGYLKPELKGGSMTFLPIVEILQGDVTGYISTNLISMTDGQIYFNSNLFNKGLRPAVDFGLSVSRIGSKAQWPAVREVSKSLRIDYLQYQELLQMSQIRASALSKEAETKLKRGAMMTQILTQDKNKPVPIEYQVLVLFALSKGLLDSHPPAQVREFVDEFNTFIQTADPEILTKLRTAKELSPEMKKKVEELIKSYFEHKVFKKPAAK